MKLENLNNASYLNYLHQPSVLTVVQSSQLSTYEINDMKIRNVSKVKADVSCIKSESFLV